MNESPAFKVYISFDNEDTRNKVELIKVLYAVSEKLDLTGGFETGEKDKMNRAQYDINQADLFILLVSKQYVNALKQDPDPPNRFLDLSLIQIELTAILERNRKDGTRIIPVIMEPCNWKETAFSGFMPLPKNGKPVNEYKNRDEAFAEIVELISAILQVMRNKKATAMINKEMEAKSGRLRLNDCNLSVIPAEVLGMPWLNELFLENNRIEKIANLDQCTRLTYLSLQHNEITSTANIGHLVNLVRLDLSYNRIEHIAQLENLVNLKELDLHHNRIKRLENLDRLTSLRFLGLSANAIPELSGIAPLTKLESLYVSHNELERIDALRHLTNLKRVVLTNNRIQSLEPLSAHIIKGLKVRLEYSFSEKEEGIFIKDNLTLSEPSMEVIEKGQEAIIKYFEDSSKHGTVKLQIIKLILVGNSRVGKTNFSELIRTGGITAGSSSTHILDISKWETALPRAGEGTVLQVNIFDFGGQDYYHDSHQLYYTHDTAYILMWDQVSNLYEVQQETIADTDETIDYENYPLQYWLESISYNLAGKGNAAFNSTTGNTAGTIQNPILVLQNKIDVSDGKLDQLALNKKYPNIWGYYSFSLTCKKRTGIITEVLNDYLSSLNTAGRQLIRYEMDIVKQYLNSDQDLRILSLPDFLAACKTIINNPSIEFNEANAEIIAQVLNNTGLALYDKAPDGHARIYTNIRKLNELIKAIMDVARKGNDKGIFSRDQVAHVAFNEEILGLLSRNNSIISINGNDYITPQFLPLEPDPSISFFLPAFSYTQIRYVYEAYFHKSLLLNLFSRYLKDIHIDTSEGVKRFPFWRNGIIVSRVEGGKKEMVYVKFEKREKERG